MNNLTGLAGFLPEGEDNAVQVGDGHWGRGWDLAWDNVNEDKVGVSMNIITQFALKWKFPFSARHREGNNMVVLAP